MGNMLMGREPLEQFTSEDRPRNLRREGPELVSIVVPVYNEAENVQPLADAVAEALAGQKYELIFVDDGSEDATFENIDRLARGDGRVCGVSLSRNFGHQYALAAGLRFAKGRAVVTMDGDMQHPPSLLPVLIDRWRDGYNVVQTRREDNAKVPWAKRVTSRAFYRVFSVLCGIRIDPGMADFRLLDRTIIDELNAMSEGQLFLRGLIAWMGYKKAVVPFQVAERRTGRSKYTVRSMLKFAKSGVLSFSSVPLRIATVLGLVMSLLSFVELLYVLIAYLAGRTAPGWASTVAVMSLLFGVLFILIGLQGEYILRIYERVRSRPSFLIERVIGRERTQAQGNKPPEAPEGSDSD